ncbi:MAG: cadherin repeat domain-containing protein [Patescibacteria group bacterium]
MKTTRGRLFYIAIIVLFLVVFALVATPYKSFAASWEQAGTDGFGDANNSVVTRLTIFNDQIYATVSPLVTGFPITYPGVRIYRSSDGNSWTKVNTDGFGSADNEDGVSIVYNNALYTGTTNDNGFQLWKTTNGTDYTQIGTSGFGDTDNDGVFGMEIFNNKLYLSVEDTVSGGAIYRLDSDTSWTQVNTSGFGSNNNTNIFSLKAFGGNLYAGTANSTNGAQVWRSADGTSWTQANTSGFNGDINNNFISTFFYLGDYLYAGTYNTTTGTEVWRSSNGTTWAQVNTDGFGSAGTYWSGDVVAVVNGTIYLGTANTTVGGRMYTSTNGTTWTQEGSDGFGSAANFATYAVTFNGRIYIGFSNNDTGLEIWRTAAMDTLSITTMFLGDEIVGGSYSVQLQTSAGTAPITYSITSGSLPDGQTLNSTGTISGTPTKAGTYTFTVSATDSGSPQQLASRQLSIKVVAAPTILPETGASGYSYLDLVSNLF